jgi:aminoglycoside 3-N-acetyltransferase
MEGSPVTRSDLAAGLLRLGLRAGGVAMAHTRMSALGWVVGGSETVVRALLDALGPGGTLMAYASWEEHVYRASDRPEERRAAYAAEPPVFDPATGEVAREYGRIPERIRTWPGAERSTHPEAGVVAVGPRARRLTQTHPPNDGYGAASPFARLVEAGGQVLMLGAPLDTITLLHHAEAIARAPRKRRLTYTVVVATDAGPEERTFTDIDTADGAFPYDELALADDPFAVIAREALAAGIGTHGQVGHASCHLFPAAELAAFGVAWLEERFA